MTASDKRIYTSNYSRSGKNKNAVAISQIVPDWFLGTRLPQLAPTWQLIVDHKEDRISNAQFAANYIESLVEDRGFSPEYILSIIPDNAILLCYEKPGEFCHRRVLAEFLEKHLNMTIHELGYHRGFKINLLEF